MFPKCYFDALVRGEMDYVAWIRAAAALGGDGLEHYDGFFRSFDADRRRSRDRGDGRDGAGKLDAVFLAGLHPSRCRGAAAPGGAAAGGDRSGRQARHEILPHAERTALAGPVAPRRNRPHASRAVRSLDYAEKRDVVLCLENHYKDGTWLYPEFAQPEDIFLEILDHVDSPRLGVQYDPSNAVVGGYDPIRFLEKVMPRVVTMHASDRALAPGATLEDLREADGKTGYSDKLRHGEVGKGLIDYDTIFAILARHGYSGWISVEDGVNGLDELERSVAFLKRKRDQFY